MKPAKPPFPLTYCPECGYQLAGLPSHGKCPECGVAYDEETIVLWGWAAGPRANLATSRPEKYGAWMIVAAAIFLMFHALTSGEWICFSLAIALGVIPALYSLYERNFGYNRPPRPTQLVITPAGLAQRDGFGGVRVVSWAANMLIEYNFTPPASCRLRATCETDLGQVELRPCDFDCELSPEQFDKLLKILTERALPHATRIRRIL